ncbi:MAG: metallophosphoesterase family protein [Thermoplasmata archaeon]
MNILVMSDLHSRINYFIIDDLVKKHSAGIVFLLGDLTNFGPPEIVLDLKSGLVDVIAIPGNCDPVQVLDFIDRAKIINAHRKKIIIKNFEIVGLGGSDRDFVNMGIYFDDNDAYEFLSKNLTTNSYLLLHQPPYGILDTVRTGNGGNRGIRKAVFEKRPRVVFSGHIHEARGMEDINGIKFINPGAARDGNYAVFNTDTMNVEFLNFE